MKNVAVALECACRLGLAAVYVYSAWSKMGDPALFADAVARFEILPGFAIGVFAIVLPAFELVAGMMFVFTKWLREAALASAGMLVMFIVALSLAVARGLDIDCGCFGGSGGGKGELVTAIARDFVLLVPSVWLMFRRNRWLFGK